MKCPNCGGEVDNGYNFCKYCGMRLNGTTATQVKPESSVESEVMNTVTIRLNGIQKRDENAVRLLIDEHYNKFDDWPPFARQEAEEALRNEFSAFKVLSNYSYELKDAEVKIFGDIAIATFHIRYQGDIRDRRFTIVSRVTSVLRKQGTEWK
ncbi:MAG: DUF4440 domain-containing protein, partial [Candidatus Bathyarchaeota archaeon]